MLNLLIISAHPRAATIRDRLQPVLKARVDLLTDFDHGLKEVFEKRPGAVLIQETIADVPAENAARHIKMLLGTTAPEFILLHDSDSQVKPVAGLFEHVLDIGQPAASFFEMLLTTLKRIYGGHWNSIYIGRELSAGSVHPGGPECEPILVEKHAELESFFESPAPLTESSVKELKPPETALSGRPVIPVHTKQPEAAVSGDGATVQKNRVMDSETVLPEGAEDILASFERNYRDDQGRWKSVAAVAVLMVAIAAAGWTLWGDRIQTLFTRTAQKPPTAVPAKPSTSQTGSETGLSAPDIQKQVSSAGSPQSAGRKLLPSFIPDKSRDMRFSGQRSGWERYLTADADFRVFRKDGQIRAIQVLSLPGRTLAEPFLKSVLLELTGSSDLKLKSSRQQAEALVQAGNAGSREVLVYRSIKNSTIIAFVVALD